VTKFGAAQQTQGTAIQKTPKSRAGGAIGNTDPAGEPGHGKAKTPLPFQVAVAEEIGIDGAVDDVEFEARNERVVDVFPHHDRIDFSCFHVG